MSKWLGIFIFIIGISSFGETLQRQNIEFDNISPEMVKDIESRYFTRDSGETAYSVLDDIIRYIHSKISYDMVAVSKKDDKYTIRIINSTRVSKVLFSGNQVVSQGELRNLLGVQENDILDTNLALEGAERIRKYYNEIGYLNTSVNIEIPESPGEKHRVEIDIKIDEGVPTKISEIIVNSPNVELNKKVLSALKPFKNKFYTENTIFEIQKNIKEYFKENSIIQGELVLEGKKFDETESFVSLSFSLQKTQKYQFVLNGYNKVSRIKLNKVIDVENYNSSNPNVAAELAVKLKNYYLEKGYARVDVKASEQEINSYERKIIFDIEEGPRVFIDKVVFQGSFQQPVEFYEKLFFKNASELIQDRYYNKDQVEEAINNLKLELQNLGYLMVQVQNTRTVYSSTKDKVSLFITFDEGPLTLVDSVSFQGNEAFTKEQLIDLIGLAPGAPLELYKLEKSVAKIKSFYKENGFLEVAILNEKEGLVNYDSNNTRAKLHFNIVEGPQVRVGSIAVEGNFFTQEKIVLIELEFSKGEILTPSKMEESVSRLQKTGYFNTVEIKTLEQRTSVSNRTVLVKVTERDPGLFTMGVGATNERNGTIRGYAGIAYRNILGTGRGVSARSEGKYNIADIKYPEFKVVLGYMEPYLFSSRLRGRVDVSGRRYVSDFETKKATESMQYIWALEKDFTSHVTGIFEVYNLETFRDFLFATENKETTQELNIASIGPTLDIDYRDNPFLPSKGIFARFNLEYASPPLGSSDTIEYYRATGSFTHYWPVKSQWVWAHNVRLGYLENLSKNPEGGIPYSKKGFILGGRSTIRGFEAGTQEVIPNNDDLGIKTATDVFNLKTNASEFLFKSELRFPIYGNFYGGVFYDGGSVYIKDLPFRDNYRDSIGIGLRFNTPAGAFNMEIGKKLDRRENEEDLRYHLSFGTF